MFLLGLVISAAHQFGLGMVKRPHQKRDLLHNVPDNEFHGRYFVEEYRDGIQEATMCLYIVSEEAVGQGSTK